MEQISLFLFSGLLVLYFSQVQRQHEWKPNIQNTPTEQLVRSDHGRQRTQSRGPADVGRDLKNHFQMENGAKEFPTDAESKFRRRLTENICHNKVLKNNYSFFLFSISALYLIRFYTF